MEYLDEVFPSPRLSPSDPKTRAEMRAWLRFFEGRSARKTIRR